MCCSKCKFVIISASLSKWRSVVVATSISTHLRYNVMAPCFVKVCRMKWFTALSFVVLFTLVEVSMCCVDAQMGVLSCLNGGYRRQFVAGGKLSLFLIVKSAPQPRQ